MNINELGNSVSVTDSRGGTQSYTYIVASDDVNYLSISADGKISAKAAGTATIYVTDASNPDIKSNEIEITVSNLYRLYFMDDWQWNNVYIHIWNSTQPSYHTTWSSCPKMTNVYGTYDSPYGNGARKVFYYDLPADAKCLIKKAAGDTNDKLPDINTLEVGKYYSQLWDNKNANGVHDISTIA